MSNLYLKVVYWNNWLLGFFFFGGGGGWKIFNINSLIQTKATFLVVFLKSNKMIISTNNTQFQSSHTCTKLKLLFCTTWHFVYVSTRVLLSCRKIIWWVYNTGTIIYTRMINKSLYNLSTIHLLNFSTIYTEFVLQRFPANKQMD